MIDGAEKPLPSYGSPEWLALPEGDRRKVAAVVVAAECWATDLDDLPARTLAESRAFKAAEDADYQARAAAHRREWSHLSGARGPAYDQTNPPRDLRDIGREYVESRRRIGRGQDNGVSA